MPASSARAASAPAARIQVNDVLGLSMRARHAKIVFDQDDAVVSSSCVACGECVQACPTGALMPARRRGLVKIDAKVDSVCPTAASAAS